MIYKKRNVNKEIKIISFSKVCQKFFITKYQNNENYTQRKINFNILIITDPNYIHKLSGKKNKHSQKIDLRFIAVLFKGIVEEESLSWGGTLASNSALVHVR